jgi:hypothetical protein
MLSNVFVGFVVDGVFTVLAPVSDSQAVSATKGRIFLIRDCIFWKMF